MKKFLSIILALVTMFCIGTTSFAYENVDNTFDNFTPGPGVQAPDNWYDPYSYDEEGLILPCSLIYDENTALYCKKSHKMWQSGAVKAENDFYFEPYKTLISVNVNGESFSVSANYCPYCGECPNTENRDFEKNHMYLQGVIYGTYCKSCGNFSGYPSVTNYERDFYCHHCSAKNNPIDTKFYRFVCEKDLNSEASHLYSDSAHLYGDGKDGKIEDLERNGVTIIIGWNNPDEEPTELTFWQKIVQFFQNIASFFVKLFTWSW